MATTYTFRPTERRQAKLRMALGGPAGSGKTMTALIVASYLGDRIALIDSERGSSQKYADEPGLPPFDVLTLEAFSPEEYIAAIKAAKEADYPVLIIDSISHAWAGPGGILELVDQVTLSSKSKNAYTEGWRKATPLHNRFVDTMLQYPGHLIMTVRSKIARVIEDEGPKKGTPRIIGMEWVQRDSMEYEVDVAGELDKENTLVITKSRCQALHGQVFVKPGQEFATILVKWLSSGAPTETRDAHPTPLPPEARSDLMSRQQATAEGTLPPLAGANGPHVNRGDRQLAQTKQEVILDIVAALKRKYPGDDKTAKQDRADLAREYFGTDVFADFKALPLSLLRDGLARLTRPVIGERPSEPDDDVPTHAPPGTVGDGRGGRGADRPAHRGSLPAR